MEYNIQEPITYNIQIDSNDVEDTNADKFNFEVLIAPTNTDIKPYFYIEFINIKKIILKNVILIGSTNPHDITSTITFPPLLALHIKEFDTIEQMSTDEDKNVFILIKDKNYDFEFMSGFNKFTITRYTSLNNSRNYPSNNLLNIHRRLTINLYDWITKNQYKAANILNARMIIEFEFILYNKYLRTEFNKIIRI